MKAGHSQNSLPFYVISGLLPVVSLAGWSSDFLNGSLGLLNRGLELTQHHFYHNSLIKAVTAKPRFKGWV